MMSTNKRRSRFIHLAILAVLVILSSPHLSCNGSDPGPVDLLDGVEPNADVANDMIALWLNVDEVEGTTIDVYFNGEVYAPVVGLHPTTINGAACFTAFVNVPDHPSLEKGRSATIEVSVIDDRTQQITWSNFIPDFLVLPDTVLLNVEYVVPNANLTVEAFGWGFAAESKSKEDNVVSYNMPSQSGTVLWSFPGHLCADVPGTIQSEVVDFNLTVQGTGETSHVFAGPWIMRMSPPHAGPGDVVVIEGSFFDTVSEANNTIRFVFNCGIDDLSPVATPEDDPTETPDGRSAGIPEGPEDIEALERLEFFDSENIFSCSVDATPDFVSDFGMSMSVRIPRDVPYGNATVSVIVSGIESNPYTYLISQKDTENSLYDPALSLGDILPAPAREHPHRVNQ
ncbi:hypothetical protein ACFL4G_01155 [Thermodesulfobacteriota bacterium]